MDRTLGQHIRILREEKGLTQRALSQAVGFRSLAHLSDIEAGKRNPGKETLAKFAKALDVPVSELAHLDTREAIEAAKLLFARRPEMVGVFLKIIAVAKDVSAEELLGKLAPPARSSSEKSVKSLAPKIAEKASAPVASPSAQATFF